MGENQKRVLQMVSDGKISVDEAERLLKLIGAEKTEPEEMDVPPAPPVPPVAPTAFTDEKKQPVDNAKPGSRVYTGFTRVHVSSAVDVKISRDEQFSVNATPEDLRELDIEQDGETLRIRRPGFWGMWMGWGTRPRVRITMPEIEAFKINGASYGWVKDFTGDQELKLVVNGASHMKVNNMTVGHLKATVEGASGLGGDIKVTGEATMIATGAARLELTGEAQSARIDLIGASNMKMGDFTVQKADVSFTGAANGSLRVDGDLDARLAGASTLFVKGNTKIGNIETSGASHLHRA